VIFNTYLNKKLCCCLHRYTVHRSLQRNPSRLKRRHEISYTYTCDKIRAFTSSPNSIQFLARDAMRKCGLCWRPVSVRPCVTLVDCIQMVEDIVKLLSRPGSPIILVFWLPAPYTQFQGEPLQRGTKYMGVEKIAIFDGCIAVYLGNSTR